MEEGGSGRRPRGNLLPVAKTERRCWIVAIRPARRVPKTGSLDCPLWTVHRCHGDGQRLPARTGKPSELLIYGSRGCRFESSGACAGFCRLDDDDRVLDFATAATVESVDDAWPHADELGPGGCSYLNTCAPTDFRRWTRFADVSAANRPAVTPKWRASQSSASTCIARPQPSNFFDGARASNLNPPVREARALSCVG